LYARKLEIFSRKLEDGDPSPKLPLAPILFFSLLLLCALSPPTVKFFYFSSEEIIRWKTLISATRIICNLPFCMLRRNLVLPEPVKYINGVSHCPHRKSKQIFFVPLLAAYAICSLFFRALTSHFSTNKYFLTELLKKFSSSSFNQHYIIK
jgi:hypothetical protein